MRRAVAALLCVTFLSAWLLACSSSDGETDGPHFILATENRLVEVRGDNQSTLLEFPDISFVLDPAVSPDGRRLAFVRQPPASIGASGGVDFGSDVWVANRDGSDRREVAKHAIVGEFLRTPAFLTDDVILFAVRSRTPGGEQRFYIDSLDLRTDERRTVVEDASDPVGMSPDRASVAYVYLEPGSRDEFLAVSGADFTSPTLLAGTSDGLGLIQSTVWSPDGSMLAFAAVDLDAPATEDPLAPGMRFKHPFAQDLWVINRDGSGLRRLVELADNQLSFGWSQDGNFIYALGINGFWRVALADGGREPVGLDVAVGEMHWLAP